MNLARRNTNSLPTNNRFDALKTSEVNPFKSSGGRRRHQEEQNVDPRPMRRARNTESKPAVAAKFEIRDEAFPDLGAPRAEPEPMPTTQECKAPKSSWASRLSSGPVEETKEEEVVVKPVNRAPLRRSGVTKDVYNCQDVLPGWISIMHDKQTGDVIRSHGPVTERMKALLRWQDEEPIRHARAMLVKEQRRRDLDVELFGDFSEYYGVKSLLEDDSDDYSSEGDAEEEDSDGSSGYIS